MPNWVFNTLHVSGEPSELEKMVTQLNQPFVKNFPQHDFVDGGIIWTNNEQVYDNPVFAFWNIVKPTDLESYYEKDPFKSTADLDGEEFMAEFERAMKEDQDWYHWNCRNWGTKWDVAVSNGDEYPNAVLVFTNNNSDYVMYNFQTAWSPVLEVLLTLSKQFPTLEFNYEYEEEKEGWGGIATLVGGVEITSEEWDAPMSHSDYTERDKDCICPYSDSPEDWFEDCPVDTSKYRWDSSAQEWQDIV